MDEPGVRVVLVEGSPEKSCWNYSRPSSRSLPLLCGWTETIRTTEWEPRNRGPEEWFVVWVKMGETEVRLLGRRSVNPPLFPFPPRWDRRVDGGISDAVLDQWYSEGRVTPRKVQ